MTHDLPTIPIVVELGEPISRILDGPLARELERRLAAELQPDIERRWGLRDAVDVRVTPSRSSRAVRVWVHGRLQPYPPELMRRVWSAVVSGDDLLAWPH